MAYVIAEPCIGTKDTACVPVCPVDCIYAYDEVSGKLAVKDSGGAVRRAIDPNPNLSKDELSKQLFIQPDECIDCGVCVDVCPVQAIFPVEDLPEKWRNFTDINRNAFAP